jgi:hypothetical protein
MVSESITQNGIRLGTLMGLKLKWQLRQIALEYVTWLFSLTSTLLAYIGITFWKYVQYGGELNWPKGTKLGWMLEWFYLNHIKAVVIWIPIALFVDILIRRLVYRLNDYPPG